MCCIQYNLNLNRVWICACMHAFLCTKNGCVYLLWKQSFKPYDCSIVHHVKTGELHAALTTVTSLIVLLLHERFLKCPFIPHKSKHLKTPRVSFLKRLSSVALLCNTKEKKRKHGISFQWVALIYHEKPWPQFITLSNKCYTSHPVFTASRVSAFKLHIL